MLLVEYRRVNQISQMAFANLIKVDKTTISKYENNRIVPSHGVLLRIEAVTAGLVTTADFHLKEA